jgi:cytochrome c peroxidase
MKFLNIAGRASASAVAGVLCTALSTTLLPAAQAAEPIPPLEPVADVDAAKVELGKQLYFDPRLSKSGFISCNSCHNLSMGGTDNLPTSIGHNWQQGPINSPTVLNSRFNIAQFWDGRAADLKEQAAGPIANPGEMAFTHELAVEVVATIPGYVDAVATAYGDREVTIDRLTDAIAEFEKTLVTPNSPFDRWLKGDETALDEDELAGYQLFKTSGCIACHSGAALGGAMFQKVGLVQPYETDNPAVGRAEVTGNDTDRMVFKVPTLRNVELTYPYFHAGQVATLAEAVDLMGRLQLGREFSDEEIDSLVAFLKSLTGEQPSFALPQLPPSSPETPRPTPFGP